MYFSHGIIVDENTDVKLRCTDINLGFGPSFYVFLTSAVYNFFNPLFFFLLLFRLAHKKGATFWSLREVKLRFFLRILKHHTSSTVCNSLCSYPYHSPTSEQLFSQRSIGRLGLTHVTFNFAMVTTWNNGVCVCVCWKGKKGDWLVVEHLYSRLFYVLCYYIFENYELCTFCLGNHNICEEFK